MRTGKSSDPTLQKPLRLWPGITAAILLLLCKLIVPLLVPDALPIAMLGGLFFGLMIILWWLFFSRAPWFERLAAFVLMIIAMVGAWPLLHISIATGAMGMLFPLLAIPMLCLAFVISVVISRHFSAGRRRLTVAVTILLAVGCWTVVRTGGLDNSGKSDLAWRWTPTPEERLLAQTVNEPMVQPQATVKNCAADWSGFRGSDRDGIVRGVAISTDWSTALPVKLWSRPVGPGWSSFAVYDNLFYTQEQRGDDEVVSCYNTSSGGLVWKHSDKTRFWESNGDAGPRATPTLKEGRVYTLGATGIVNVLDAADGHVIWSHNAATDTDTKVPMWGFASSPLVVNDMIVVAAAGSLISYDRATGRSRWSKPAGGDCYSSPHLVHIGGVEQILLQNDAGVISVAPADGALLWQYSWAGHPIVQPALTADGDILVSVDDRSGVRRISVACNAGEWSVKERWSSTQIKPYFNDSVVHKGHVYGFDGPALACINVTDGLRKWKGGHYGRGQFILLADQDLLLVLSEKGELALVSAVPAQFKELARIPAIKGKTWNHPVLVNDILLVRNAEEMAAFRLSPAGV
jgi:outer membrane protein assembly factor BamB